MAREKKGLPGIVIFLIVILVLVGIPVGLYYGLVHDGGHKEITYDPNFKSSEVMTNTVAKAFNEVKDTKKLSLGLSTSDMNNLLHEVSKDLEETGYVKGLYVEANGKKLDIVIEGQVLNGILASKLRICTELKDEKVDDKDAFIFQITNIKVGRISGLQSIAIDALKGFMKEEDLNKTFQSAGFSAKVDYAKRAIIYKKADLANDLGSVSGSGESLPIIPIVQLLCENNLLSLSDKDGVYFDIDLEPMTVNSERVEAYELDLNNPSKHNAITLDGLNTKLGNILTRNKSLKPSESIVYKFLFKGYSALSNSEKEVINALDLTDMGAGFVKETYKGFDLPSQTMRNVFQDEISNNVSSATLSQVSDPAGFTIFDIKENVLSSFLSNSDIVGFNQVFGFNVGEEILTNYVVVDNMYCNIYDSHIEFVTGLNLNGLETTIIISSEINQTDSKVNLTTGKSVLALDLKGVKLGSIEANEAVERDIYSLLGDGMDDSIKFSLEKKQLQFDLSSAMSDGINSLYSEVFNNSTMTFSSIGANKEANGSLKLVSKYNG